MKANSCSPLSFLHFESSFFLKLAASNDWRHLCKILHCSPTDSTRGHPASGARASGNLPRHPGRPQSQPFPAWPLSLQLSDLCKTPHHHIVLFSVYSCFCASICRRPAPKNTQEMSLSSSAGVQIEHNYLRELKDTERGVQYWCCCQLPAHLLTVNGASSHPVELLSWT